MIERLLERRRYIRHPLNLPLEFKVLKKTEANKYTDTSGPAERSAAINVSQGGLLFSSKRPVRTNSRIIIKMPFQNRIFNVRARVVHCHKSLDTRLYHMGVCFERLSDAFKVKLIEQIYLICEYRDLRSIQLGKEMSLEEASLEWIKRYSERFRRLYW